MFEPDHVLLRALNGYVGQSAKVDAVMIILANAKLLKMTPMVLVLWGFWFIPDERSAGRKQAVVLALLGCFFAMATARILALTLPFRVRPLLDPSVSLQVPPGWSRGSFEGWSAMPSDHAALAFALATGIFLISRPWGIWAFLHAALLICLPRAYLLLHHPTDLAVGALVGVVAVVATTRLLEGRRGVAAVITFGQQRPVLSSVLSLLIVSQMMEMFDSVRNVAGGLFHLIIGRA